MASINPHQKSNPHHPHQFQTSVQSILQSHQLNQVEISEIEGVQHVVIIGAGISGLSAGLKLIKLNYNVIIVEARDRVGGRIESREFKKSKNSNQNKTNDDEPSGVVDLGASFLHGIEGNPLIELLKEYNQPIHFENEESPMKIYSFDGPALPDKLTKSLVDHAYHTFFHSARTHSQASDENPNPNESLASYLYDPQSPLFNLAKTSEDRSILAHLVGGLESWTGAALEQVSLRWWGFEREFNGKDAVVNQGYGVLVKLMAEEFIRLGGRLILGYECLGLEYDQKDEVVKTLIRPTSFDSSEDEEDESDERISSLTNEVNPNSSETLKGDLIKLTSDYAICTLPLGVLKSILIKDHSFFNPPLPVRRCEAIERIGFGLLNKVILRYERAWWPIEAPWLMLLPLNPSGSFTSSSPSSPSSISLSSSESSTSSDAGSGVSTPSSVWPSDLHEIPNKTSLLESTIFATSVKVQNYVPITGEAALVFFFGASAGEAIEELSDEAVAEMMHAKLLAHLDVSAEEEDDDDRPELPEGPSECIVTRWRKDRFSLGSYTFIPPFSKQGSKEEPATPLDIMEMSRPLWNGKLGWAGEHCQVDHYACVHGPHLSGLEEAERIHVAIQANSTGSPSSSV
ncbi:hypothetical protein DFH28DRAFT_1085655 [Melampsora americana]|nr:hypothetical protein DFH28DRAFT_1085655 [Melampsora americana]